MKEYNELLGVCTDCGCNLRGKFNYETNVYSMATKDKDFSVDINAGDVLYAGVECPRCYHALILGNEDLEYLGEVVAAFAEFRSEITNLNPKHALYLDLQDPKSEIGFYTYETGEYLEVLKRISKVHTIMAIAPWKYPSAEGSSMRIAYGQTRRIYVYIKLAEGCKKEYYLRDFMRVYRTLYMNKEEKNA